MVEVCFILCYIVIKWKNDFEIPRSNALYRTTG